MIKAVIDVWFCLSVLFAVGMNIFLHVSLWKKSLVNFFDVYAGTPGYLDRIYIGWCKDNCRSHKFVIAIRIASLASVILAGAAFAFTVNALR